MKLGYDMRKECYLVGLSRVAFVGGRWDLKLFSLPCRTPALLFAAPVLLVCRSLPAHYRHRARPVPLSHSGLRALAVLSRAPRKHRLVALTKAKDRRERT